jgi:hypothetical protein
MEISGHRPQPCYMGVIAKSPNLENEVAMASLLTGIEHLNTQAPFYRNIAIEGDCRHSDRAPFKGLGARSRFLSPIEATSLL